MTDDEFAERLKRQILDAYGFDEAPWEEQASTAGDPTTAEDERVTWLLRQIAYEEGGARQAAEYNATTWTCISTGVLDYAKPGEDVWPLTIDGSAAQHMADHDPERVLRDVRAKRALLADILALRDTAPVVADHMLLCMTAPYADRDAYGWREEWRVPGLDEDGTPRVLDGELAAKELA
jgi:hypothetical protein